MSAADIALRGLHAQFVETLAAVEGRDFGSLEENRRVAQMIQDTADTLRVAFKCTKCSAPARLRCSQVTRMPHGSFAFTHSTSTHGGTSTFPKLSIVEKPEDGRRAKD